MAAGSLHARVLERERTSSSSQEGELSLVRWQADPSDHPALQCEQLWSGDFNWIAGHPPAEMDDGGTLDALVQVRHRMRPVTGRVRTDQNRWVSIGHMSLTDQGLCRVPQPCWCCCRRPNRWHLARRTVPRQRCD